MLIATLSQSNPLIPSSINEFTESVNRSSIFQTINISEPSNSLIELLIFQLSYILKINGVIGFCIRKSFECAKKEKAKEV